MRTFLLACLAALSALAAEAKDVVIPIRIDRPAGLQTETWPLTVGVPFAQGVCADTAHLTLTTEDGAAAPFQTVEVADWPDGSVRWAHLSFRADLTKRYALRLSDRAAARAAREDDIRITEAQDTLTVNTGPVQCVLAKGTACPKALALEGNDILAGTGGHFYAVDSLGRRSELRVSELRVDTPGPRRAVVRVAGDYVTEDGTRCAAAIMYLHFYAGDARVRMSHKFILTENTNDLWFRDIGLTLPLALGGAATGTLNTSHDDPSETFSRALEGDLALVMLQQAFPRFGSTDSTALVYVKSSREHVGLKAMPACGDWADVSSTPRGLAVQLPAFAERFPKAFRLSPHALTVKLWASESGRELDFRTEQIVASTIGHDWLPADHKLVKLPNTAHGTARTHDIWLYPHAGRFEKALLKRMGATRNEIYAVVDPAWVAASRVFGPLSAKDVERFPDAEKALSDYFDRSVVAPRNVFPATGYVYYGCYPFAAQPWKQRPDRGNRWYPTVHRLSRHMDYNLRRSMWQLFARSGERKYYDFARDYTRFFHDMIFANTDTPAKPLGWFAEGSWHSPLVWGHFGEGREGADFDRPAYNDIYSLTLASAADMVQFCYDYFLTGDLHSRDMARNWKNAMVKEMGFDVRKAISVFRPDGFIRILSSAYELDHDPRVLDYQRRIVRAIVPEKGPHILRPRDETGARINYGKAGEIFAALYYYYVATGDTIVRDAMVRLAEFTYRKNRFDQMFSRGSPLLQTFAIALEHTGEARYGAWLAQVAGGWGRNWKTLADEGINPGTLSQATTTDFGRVTLVGQAPVNVGVPVALEALARYGGPRMPLPVALKTHPTQRTHVLVKKETPGAATMDVYVNNWGHTDYAPRLLTLDGKPLALEVVEREFKYVTEPECYDQNSIWVYHFGDHLFLRLRIPASARPGVYELDLGHEVNFSILFSEAQRILQVAPDGLVLHRGHRYYFPLPAGAKEVRYFAHRPVRIFSPEGKPVVSTAAKNGLHTFTAQGVAGIWSVETSTDALLRGQGTVDTFFRLDRVAGDAEIPWPLVIAMGDAGRLFDVDPARFPAASRLPNVGDFDAANPFVAASINAAHGQALHVRNHFAEVSLAPATPRPAEAAAQARGPLPRTEGTVEFWFRPLWSATDCPMARTTQRTQFYVGDPVAISYWVDQDNAGRTGRYNLVRLAAQVKGIGLTQCNVYFERGRWYHIAVTWTVDGKDNRARIFINGRKKAYSLYKPRMNRTASPEKLPPPAGHVRIGQGDLYGHLLTAGLVDELRVSSSIRYGGHFQPPTAPFTADAETVLLMHFDGNLRANIDGEEIVGALKPGRLW